MGKYNYSKRNSAKKKRINIPMLKEIHTQEFSTIFVHSTEALMVPF